LIDAEDVRLQMRLISTSSPSYLFLTSLDHTTTQLEAAGASLVERVSNLTQIVRHFFEKRERDGFAVWRGSYRTDPWHMLVRPAGLKNFLEAHGVFPESNLGTGCLLMFGIGSTAEHVDSLLSALELFKVKKEHLEPISVACPQIPEQVFSPRDVLYMPLEVVPANASADRVAAECIAPCPPGFPLCVPGARIDSSFVTNLEKHTTSGVKVVVEK
jgi:lysine decarboxylase